MDGWSAGLLGIVLLPDVHDLGNVFHYGGIVWLLEAVGLAWSVGVEHRGCGVVSLVTLVGLWDFDGWWHG